MCGIVGAVGRDDVVNFLLSALKRLEYRGYDSSGLAIFDENQGLIRCRAVGKIDALKASLEKQQLCGKTGIAHSRWATHGEPTEKNAHPHVSHDTIFLVHNGIIENHEELRSQLVKAGYEFCTETDTEAVAHCIHYHCAQGAGFLQAVADTVKNLTGAYALAIMHGSEPERIIVVKCGSPAVIGVGEGENFVASDALALIPVTKRFIYLEEGDIADIRNDSIAVYDSNLNKIDRPIKISELSNNASELGKYKHFMQKEIFEQPKAVFDTLEGRISKNRILSESLGFYARKIFNKINGLQIIACGSSYHAALTGCYWLEKFTGLAAHAEIASEYRYRDIAVKPDNLFITISQSGETADTLAALRKAKQLPYLASLTICNVPDSSLVRESDISFMLQAGIEIGVATTKAFTAQLAGLIMLALALAQNNDNLTREKQANISTLVEELWRVPSLINKVLALDKEIELLAELFVDKQHAFFLGRGVCYPVVMEGALKLKEISYIHAEAYPAGELKHGPLALIEKNTPIVVVMPNDSLVDKLKSNLYEVKARHGELIIFADEKVEIPEAFNSRIIRMPPIAADLAPLLYTIPLQLLSYHVAALKGTDVDKPRNLAKSVTVE